MQDTRIFNNIESAYASQSGFGFDICSISSEL